ncbi:hypothetical protein F4775DRAFT_588894 [Biscogniauxia sp. FL1348]|nr:hypothetical protein F4775DRAFT_588894 [Biscogniauxia sp. FL1348]
MSPRIEHKKPIRGPRTNRFYRSFNPDTKCGSVISSPKGVKKNKAPSSCPTNVLSWLASWFVTKKVRSLSPEKADAILISLPTRLQDLPGVAPSSLDNKRPGVPPSNLLDDLLTDFETAHTQLVEQVQSLEAKVANLDKKPGCFCNKAPTPAYAAAAVPVDSAGNESSVVHEVPVKAPDTMMTSDMQKPLTTDVVDVTEFPIDMLHPQESPANESPVYEQPANESSAHESIASKSHADELHVQDLSTNEPASYNVPAFQPPMVQSYVKPKQSLSSTGAVNESPGYGTPAVEFQTSPLTPPSTEQMPGDPMSFEMENAIPPPVSDALGSDFSFDI